MRIPSLLLLCCAIGLSAATTPALAQTAPQAGALRRTITLTPSSYETGNGAAVAWHPGLKRYYTARAGNATFPMDVFDAAGSKLNDEPYQTRYDLRSLWFNTATNQLCVAGYDDAGWGAYKLSKTGMPGDITPLTDGQHQPGANSVGCYDGAKGLVYFLNGTRLYSYNAANGKEVSDGSFLNLLKGIKAAYETEIPEDAEDLPEFYNQTIVFTGIANAEFGLLNIEANRIDLFSAKTGMRTRTLKLPAGATEGTPSLFNFSYANGQYFLYNKNTSEWAGYR